MYYIVVIISVFVAACAQMLLKKGATIGHSSVWRQYLNIWVISGYGILFGSMLMNIFAMSHGVKVKEVSIIESLSYIFVPILSLACFQERLNRGNLLAIGVIMIGIMIFFA